MALAELSESPVVGDQPARNATTIEGAQQVNIKVRFAEVSRNDLKRLGINWNAVINAGSLDQAITGQFFLSDGLADAAGSALGRIEAGDVNLDFLFEALQQEGALSLLAEPNLTVLNGEEARFLAGGELPIPVPQENGNSTIEFKPFGISLNFTPVLLDNERISLRVDSEVSDISAQGAVQLANLLIPAITVRRAQTSLELASGQTFAVGGLFNRTITRNIDKIPGLGSIPILGALFRSTRYNRSETELVILITPYPLSRTTDEQSQRPCLAGPAAHPPGRPNGRGGRQRGVHRPMKTGNSLIAGGIGAVARRMFLLATLGAAGCTGGAYLPEESPVEFIEARTPLDHHVRFAPGQSFPSNAERRRLARFLDDADPELRGHVRITGGPGAAARLIRMRELLLRDRRQVSSAVDDRQPADVIVLSLASRTILPERCTGAERWDGDIATATTGLPIGCATSLNLMGMAEDQDDLTRGREPGPASAAPAAEIARRYLERWSEPPIDLPGDERARPMPDAIDAPGIGAAPDAANGQAPGQ